MQIPPMTQSTIATGTPCASAGAAPTNTTVTIAAVATNLFKVLPLLHKLCLYSGIFSRQPLSRVDRYSGVHNYCPATRPALVEG